MDLVPFFAFKEHQTQTGSQVVEGKGKCKSRESRGGHLAMPRAEGPQRISGGNPAFSLVCLLFLQRIFTEHLLADVVPGAGDAAGSCLSSWSSIALEEIDHRALNFR